MLSTGQRLRSADLGRRVLYVTGVTFPLLARTVVAGALCLLCACSAGSPRSEPAAGSADAHVQARVKAAIAGDPGLSGRMIDVSVENGVVHLSGFVQSTYDLLLVQGDARAVRGVLEVDERHLSIIRGGTPP